MIEKAHVCQSMPLFHLMLFPVAMVLGFPFGLNSSDQFLSFQGFGTFEGVVDDFPLPLARVIVRSCRHTCLVALDEPLVAMSLLTASCSWHIFRVILWNGYIFRDF